MADHGKRKSRRRPGIGHNKPPSKSKTRIRDAKIVRKRTGFVRKGVSVLSRSERHIEHNFRMSGEKGGKVTKLSAAQKITADSRYQDRTNFHQDGSKAPRSSQIPKVGRGQITRLDHAKSAVRRAAGKSLLSRAIGFLGPAGVALSAITSSKPLNVGEAEFLENEKRKVHRARKRK